ncbi:MAG: site-specific DNA-methyltransferase [Alistipes sp.]|nr:site-specific DNA-methyltransferase [Alistipes sp.]
MKRFGHPFSEELVERFLKLFFYRGGVILDPFNSAGTATCVARQTGRTYLGINLSKGIAERRHNDLRCFNDFI